MARSYPLLCITLADVLAMAGGFLGYGKGCSDG